MHRVAGFGTTKSLDIRRCRSCLTSVTIRNSVIEIENSAFDGCTSLTSVIIPKMTRMSHNAVPKWTNIIRLPYYLNIQKIIKMSIDQKTYRTWIVLHQQYAPFIVVHGNFSNGTTELFMMRLYQYVNILFYCHMVYTVEEWMIYGEHANPLPKVLLDQSYQFTTRNRDGLKRVMFTVH